MTRAGKTRLSGRVFLCGLLAALSLAQSARAHELEPLPEAEGSGASLEDDEPNEGEPSGPQYRTYTRVRGAPSQPAATHIHIDANQRLTSRSADELLRFAPAVVPIRHASEGKGMQFFLRGYDAQHGTDVELTLHGIPLNQGSHIHGHGYLDISWIPAAAISSLNVRRGSYDLEQGPFATAASIDIETEGLFASGTELTLSATHRGRAQLSALHQRESGDTELLFAAEAVYDRGWAEDFDARRGGLFLRTSTERDGLTRTHILALHHANFGLPSFLRQDDLDSGRIERDEGYGGIQRADATTALGSAGFEWDLGSGRDLELSAWADARRFSATENTTGNLVYPEFGDTREQTETRIQLGTRLHYEHRLSRNHDVEFLAGGELPWIEQYEALITEESATIRDLTRDSRILQPHAYAGFGWTGYFLDLRLRARASLRGDIYWFRTIEDTLNSERFAAATGAISPRAQLRYKLAEGLYLSAGYGRGLRPPEARSVVRVEDDATAGNERSAFGTIPPEVTVADNVDLELAWQPGERISFSVTGFASLLTNETFYDHVAGLVFQLNPSRRLGIEADLQVEIADWAELSLRGTYTNTRFRASGAPVPGSPRLLGSVDLTFRPVDTFSFGTQVQFVGERTLRYEAVAAPYTVVDVFATYQVHRNIRLEASITNAINLEYATAVYNFPSRRDPLRPPSQLPAIHVVPAQPITAQLALRATF